MPPEILLHCLDAADALVSRLKREDKTTVWEAILTTLIRLDDPSATAGLADCLRSEDAALRNEAIEALRELAASGDKANAVPPVLLSLLADPDPDVRIFAVNIIESARHPDVERWLIEVIERDAHVNVCATAVDLLCEVGTEAAIDPHDRFSASADAQRRNYRLRRGNSSACRHNCSGFSLRAAARRDSRESAH
jgi:HEAT repeat protein